ncbi:hypothetical protein TNCV_2723471 [Trichonephila clavipes]|nr:hypothetical protein TNCV_2723471 [Trichonephila clavipes]
MQVKSVVAQRPHVGAEVRRGWYNLRCQLATRLARHHTPVFTVDELWYRVEAARASVPAYTIQSLIRSIPRRISAVITTRGGRGSGSRVV